jgi:hypothetical protein
LGFCPKSWTLEPKSLYCGLNFLTFFFQGVENLKDMGFPEEDVIKALKATGNNQRAAVCFN